MTETQLQMLRAAHTLIGEILGNGGAAAATANGVEAVDLDGKYGDPEVRAKDPRDWTGEPMKGRRFSECPPEYLDMLASRFDFFAGRETDEKKARYNRLDAGRARGWAARKRNGWKGAADGGGGQWSTTVPGFDVSGFEDVTNDNDVPF
jgi:hypothetical protein